MHENAFNRYDMLKELVVHRSEWAWTYLSLGNFTESKRLGLLENDVLVWAASLALSGDCRRAMLIIEAYIVATCEVLCDLLKEKNWNNMSSVSELSLLQKHNISMAKWLTTRKWGGKLNQEKTNDRPPETSPSLSNSNLGDGVLDRSIDNIALLKYQRVIAIVMQLVSWRDLHLWYVIALTLLNDVEAEQPYSAPVNNIWFRYFFAFSYSEDETVRSDSEPQDGSNGLAGITQQKALEFLISQCSEWEVFFTSAISAFHMLRYRTSIEFASRFLDILPRNGKSKNKTYDLVVPIPEERFYRISMLVVRCRALLELGLRAEAAEDIVELMKEEIEGKGTPSEYISMFGCALALYGMPLRDAAEPLVGFFSSDQSNPLAAPFPAQVHVLSTAYYVHALTLLQLGQMDQAVLVAKVGLNLAVPFHIKEALKEVVLRASVAREDSTTILEMSITAPHQLVYLSLCPTFFGGLSPHGVHARRNTPAFRLLYPTKLPLYTSARQLLPFYMNRAFCLFHHHCFAEAWNAVCCAVEIADEIAGSTEFVFTHCFPLYVYYYACKIGFTALEYVLQKDIRKCLVGENNRLTSNFPSFVGMNSFLSRRERGGASFTASEGTIPESLTNDADGKSSIEIIDFCRYCVKQMHAHYPHSVLGDVAAAQVAVMSYEPDSVMRAVLLSRRYPKVILAQTTWALALFFDNNISNAMDASRKNFQDFPHSKEVVSTQKWMGLKGITYTFYYRTLLPMEYGPGSKNQRFTKRFLVSIALVAINWLVYLYMLIVNLTSYRPLNLSETLGAALTTPATWTFIFPPIFLVYGLLMTFSSKNLIQSLLEELHFCGGRLNRFIFVMRSVVLFNAANMLQIIFSNQWKLPNSFLLTTLLVILMIVLTMPFTTRIWFLPSVDEPQVEILRWVSLLVTDVVIYAFVIIPHVILAAFEPLMALAFFFLVPKEQLGIHTDTASIRRRLLYHEKNRYTLPPPGGVGGGSSFIYIKLMKLIYYETHIELTSRYLEKSQIESEGYRVFPLLDETLALSIPVNHSWIDFNVIQLFLCKERRTSCPIAMNPLNWTDPTSSKVSLDSSKPSSPVMEALVSPSMRSAAQAFAKPYLPLEGGAASMNVVVLPMARLIDKIFCMQAAACMGSTIDSEALRSFSNWHQKVELPEAYASYELNASNPPTLRRVDSFALHNESWTYSSTPQGTHTTETGSPGISETSKERRLARFLRPVRRQRTRPGVSLEVDFSLPIPDFTPADENESSDESTQPLRRRRLPNTRPMAAPTRLEYPCPKSVKPSTQRLPFRHSKMKFNDSEEEGG
ncbi:unnamed protein product [Phytomonas sp. EM1]|nr:unnamed protein product [Phytomonas sp. EM1]|eukprot:CCW64104.1 unnamed protein product [Phytomonas sp. isolate EM1]